MIHWFLDNQKRLSVERASIQQLQESVEWLIGVEWLLSGGLCVDAVLRVQDQDYEVRLEYPSLFPEVPPTIRPRNDKRRWSGHQYGNGGPLCLEWGPDNWQPEVRGAQLLESAYKLLKMENPMGAAQDVREVTVPSRHALTQGQELRGDFGRFFVSAATLSHLLRLGNGSIATFKFSVTWRSESLLAVVHEVRMFGTENEATWTDPGIPKYLRGSTEDALRDGILFKSNADSLEVESTVGIKGIRSLLIESGNGPDLFNDEATLRALGIDGQPAAVLVLDRNLKLHFFVVLKDGDTKRLSAIRSESDPAERTPRKLNELRHRSVGVVGLGSVGSKVAVSLARMGVRKFYLVDYDIFLPENSQRHVLDWNSLGEHKVTAVRETINRCAVDAEVEVSRVHLTGQESTAVVSGSLDKLGRCDLLIDATAEPDVFNLLSFVAATYQKPLIWVQVYGGGLGGMIARSRPTIDPPPQIMRGAYLNYCDEFPAPGLRNTSNYAVEDTSGNILTASDADVGVIAHHVARFAADTLLGSNVSTYPYSMYLIGLAKWWVFDAPFATIPIATNHLMPEAFSLEPNGDPSAEENDNRAFIISLLEKRSEASSPS